MRSLMRKRSVMVGAAALAAGALALGGGVAIAGSDAATDDDLTALAERLEAKDAFATSVAEKLGTTAAKLESAITEAAADRIDAAEKSGGITAANAATIRAALEADERLALRIAQGADVAKKLGVTEAKLDAAYADVQKAQALARIDQAVKDGFLTEKVAEQMRTRIEAADFPGFGAGMGGRGFGGRGHGFGGPGLGHHGPGMAGEGGPLGLPGAGASGVAPATAYGTTL
jgi:hypothetical protein